MHRYISLGALLSAVVWSPEVLAKAETRVCSEVVLHAPAPPAQVKPAELPESSAPSNLSPDPAASAAQAPAGSGATESPSSASASPAGASSSGLDGASKPAQLGGPASAQAAADLASEVDPRINKDPRIRSGAHLPLGQTPTLYLKRLLDHFITHEKGFIASQTDCAERLQVELYPLKAGWSAFARYSGTGREERVDQLLPTELSQFAERSVLALLHDVPIAETLSRDNVLWADSLKSTQRIRGRSHLGVSVGTRLRAGMFDTLNSDQQGTEREVQQQLRLFTPMALALGYRGQYDQYGVSATGELDIGTGVTGVRRNPSGGNIDYGGSAGFSLHVLRYTQPRALTTPYLGAGATFAIHWFNATRAQSERTDVTRSKLYGGGLDVDLVGGYEFMRASGLSFFLQGELTIPVYAIRTENYDGRINTWFPGGALRLGANFL